jgi:hypothetical protein
MTDKNTEIAISILRSSLENFGVSGISFNEASIENKHKIYAAMKKAISDMLNSGIFIGNMVVGYLVDVNIEHNTETDEFYLVPVYSQ